MGKMPEQESVNISFLQQCANPTKHLVSDAEDVFTFIPFEEPEKG